MVFVLRAWSNVPSGLQGLARSLLSYWKKGCVYVSDTETHVRKIQSYTLTGQSVFLKYGTLQVLDIPTMIFTFVSRTLS